MLPSNCLILYDRGKNNKISKTEEVQVRVHGGRVSIDLINGQTKSNQCIVRLYYRASSDYFSNVHAKNKESLDKLESTAEMIWIFFTNDK